MDELIASESRLLINECETLFGKRAAAEIAEQLSTAYQSLAEKLRLEAEQPN